MGNKRGKADRVNVIVKTNAGKSEILGYDEDKKAYRVNVKAHPEKGKANQEIIRLFSKKFKKQARIVKGLTSKNKVIEI